MRRNGCECPWKVSQAAALVVWFATLVGCYALYIPIIRDVAVQAAVAVLYTAAGLAVTATYILVSLIDPADQGCLVEKSPLFCDMCQAFVHQGSKHCKECQKCVLGFDHHCKWVNNCIGSRNYKPFLALLSSVCSMLAVQLATGLWLAVACFRDADATAARLAAAYPVLITVQQYAAALLVYSSVVGLALLPLGDLWLLHLVLACRGLTTWDYIMANRDAQVEPSQLSRNVSRAVRYLRSLGPRSIRVQNEATVAANKRKVGINPCLACRTQAVDTPNSAAQLERFFRPGRPEGFDAALIFTPRFSVAHEQEQGEAAAAQATGQVRISVVTLSHNAQQGGEPSYLAANAATPAKAATAAVRTWQQAQQQQLQQSMPPQKHLPLRVETNASSGGQAPGIAVRFAE